MLERIVVTEPFLRVGCQLGESMSSGCISSHVVAHVATGPVFEHRTSTLHFIDIVQKKARIINIFYSIPGRSHPQQVFHLDTTTHSLTSDTFPEAVTGLALCRGGGVGHLMTFLA